MEVACRADIQLKIWNSFSTACINGDEFDWGETIVLMDSNIFDKGLNRKLYTIAHINWGCSTGLQCNKQEASKE